MNRTDARNLITENARRTLIVRFIKRTTGELRRMVCIYYPEGAKKATFRFNPVAKGLVPVWDVEKGGHRFINLDGVQSVKIGGRHLNPKERREADRDPKPRQANADTPWENLEEANREMKELFG